MPGTKKVLLRNTGNYALVDEEDFQKVDFTKKGVDEL